MTWVNSRRWLLLLLLSGLAVRAGYCLRFPQWGPGGAIPDLNWYETLAESLLSRGELRDPEGRLTAVREPGYPLVLAAVYKAVGRPSYPAGQALNCVLSALTILLVYLLGRDVFGERTGRVAAAIAAFYPQFIYYANTLDRESLQVFLAALALWLLVRARAAPSPRRYAAAGAVMAACALVNSVFLPAGLALAGGVALFGRARGGGVSRAAVFLGVMLAVYAPWPWRNWSVFGRPVLGVNSGAHLYIGLIVPNDVAGTADEPAVVENDPVARRAAALPEAQRDALFYREALSLIRREPGRFAVYVLKSFLKLWRLYPYQRAYAHGYGLVKWTSLLSDGWIIPLAVAGMLLAGRRFLAADLLYILLGSVSLVYAVFWAIIRYRLPMMPFAILFCAYALVRAWERFAPKPAS